MIWNMLAEEIIETAHALANKGLVTGSAGNVSARIDPSCFVITPTGVSYDSIKAHDLVTVDMNGRTVSGTREPSKEMVLHKSIYQARPDAQAVIHTHSPYASALAVNRLRLPAVVDELIFKTGGPVEVAEYGYPGTEDLARKLIEALGGRQAALLANHGVVCVGVSQKKTLVVCEVVEEAAKIYVLARLLGQAHELDPDVVLRQEASFREKARKDIQRLHLVLPTSINGETGSPMEAQ